MKIIANLGTLLIAVGCASILNPFWESPKPWPFTFLFLPACIGIGWLCLKYHARQYARIAKMWSDYEPMGKTCADSFQKRIFSVPTPPRPNIVSDSFIDIAVPDPLDSRMAQDIMTKRVPEVIASLLSPCGENRTYLGRADAIVCERGPIPSERLKDAWVIDREWEDGRWTTEWLYASLVGTRLRIVGGGRAFGPRKEKTKKIDYHRKLLLLCTVAYAIVGLIFAAMQICFWYIIAFLFLFSVHELLCIAFPVYMKASLTNLNENCVPFVALHLATPFEGDTSALKLRVGEAASSLNMLCAVAIR